ncbi:MAG: alpha/beta hydrolase [Bacteroidota bacterium]
MSPRHFQVLLLIAVLVSGCDKPVEEVQIVGRIDNPVHQTIRIGDAVLLIAPDGSFQYKDTIGRPELVDVAYGELVWPLFLLPGTEFEIRIPEDSLATISFGGDLASSNAYLLKTVALTQDINNYLDSNWVSIHTMDQTRFVSIIDSLKECFWVHLTSQVTGGQSLPGVFTRAWKAEVNYALNALILRYPERYRQFPQAPIQLSRKTLAYIEKSPIDNLQALGLMGYKTFARAWIDYHVNEKVRANASDRHRGLVKMDEIYHIIDQNFKKPYLVDYWKWEYIKAHLELHGYTNGMSFLEQYLHTVQTKSFRDEAVEYVQAQEASREGNEVALYKSVRGFNLEAHIFKPDSMEPVGRYPAIVIFHGGGWNSGNPSWAFGRAEHYAKLGMVAIAAQYRLTNSQDITAVESMADARDLVMWMRSHADILQIDPNKIAGYGWSAGAHLISSAAIFPDTLDGSSITSCPNALILVSPAVSLPKGEDWEYWTHAVLGTKATVDEVNPVEHVRAGLPPVIILEGRDDTVTPLEGVQRFADRMKSTGNRCELWVYDAVGHLFTPSSIPDYGWPQPDQAVQKRAFDQADLFLGSLGYIVVKSH